MFFLIYRGEIIDTFDSDEDAMMYAVENGYTPFIIEEL